MKIDLSKFRQTYLQESAEHVASIEADLLALRSAPGEVETLNSIFRAAHSIKGGAGTFGLTQLMHFTHSLETLLDSLRALELPATNEVINLLLQSVDVLRSLVAAGADAALPPEGADLIEQFKRLLAGASSAGEANPAATTAASTEEDDFWGEPQQNEVRVELTVFRVEFRPRREIFSTGTNPVLLLRNLASLGTVSTCQMHAENLPALKELDPQLCYLGWTVEMATDSAEDALREVFEFAEHVADIRITRVAPATEEEDRRSLEDRRDEERRILEARRVADVPKAVKKSAIATDTSSIRVATDKVDRLIDLVGELVIAQVMTAQMLESFEPSHLPKIRDAVQAMERSTRELHERVMAVRMMPVGTMFRRYARTLYDIAQSTGKQIRLETDGEDTEIDKSMLELLADPLTHLIRNAADHGIELPADRVAAGKTEEGVIHMRAFHRAGRVVVEIADDGAGIDTARVRAKAVERGLIEAKAVLSEDQLRMLIFEPGFSTREAVTDLSGRGVGMDVVKRNVQQLSGTVGLESVLGKGSTVFIELPLTLAILEGLLVRVADRTLVLPLLVVVEAVSPRTHRIRRLAEQGEVIVIREESIPVLRLRRFLQIEEPAAAETDRDDSRLVVIVEAGRRKIGLAIDELLGQQQVVVKSLETHLHKVDGLMGATILGDGRVAPILDVAVLAELNLFSFRAQASRPRWPGTPPFSPDVGGQSIAGLQA